MKRRFNTTGPCRPDWHYMIPAERRIPEAPGFVEQMAYFVVHAPRQTGKTTALMALARSLTAAGRFAALHMTCEQARAFPDDVAAAEKVVWSSIELAAKRDLPEPLRPPPRVQADPGGFLNAQLSSWAQTCPRPLVLVFDEIDSLTGPTLIAVLSQLRAGFPHRPAAFPASVVLCGVRDVRDYKAASGGDPKRLGSASPFNIKLESLRVGDFVEEEMRELYGEHTRDTGQAFTEQALVRAFELTRGQPWLVNALGREVVEKMAVPPSEPITEAHIEEAKERLILARATHLDSLVATLYEPRVRPIIEPLLAGTLEGGDNVYADEMQYVRDLGLVARDNPIRIANPIYREVVVRVLAGAIEPRIDIEPRSFVAPDGHLDLHKLLREFAEFWREHGEVLTSGASYREVAPQLVLMAFLQRIVNGGGYVDREYGVGRGRIDLLIRWPWGDKSARQWQREAIELKVWKAGDKDPLAKGLAQLDSYLERLGLNEGVLVIFDRRPEAGDPEVRTRFEQAQTPSGRCVTLLRA